MPHQLSPIALAILAAAATSPARSQSSDATPQRVEITGNALTKLDARPSSTSRLGLSVRETPAAVSLVDRGEIDAMGALDTQEILKAVPGVSFSSQPGAPGSVFYRGFGAASLSQLYNGITVQYDAIAARPVDSWIVDRVEAIGGPSSFLHGSGAVGGSINVITKIADPSGDLTHARLGLGDTRQLALSLQRGLGHAAGSHALRLDLNGTQGTHWTQGDGRRSWQAAASWLAPLTAHANHTLAVERQHERVTQPYWGTPLLRNASNAVLGELAIDPGTRGVNYNAVDGKYQQDVTWARSILQWQVAPATRATHTLYHYDALRDYENVEVYTFVNNNTQVQRSSALLQRHDQQVVGSRGELSHAAQLGGMRSDFAVGWDWSYNRQTRFPLSVNGPFDTTDPYAPAASFFYQTPGIAQVYTPGATNQLRTLALFAENRTVLAPGWALTTGLRADRIALTVTNHRTVTATNPARFETRFAPLTGRVGLVKDLAPTWQVYAQLGTAADPPSGLLATAGFSALRNFDLTRGHQLEVGSKGSFDGGRGEASVAVYEIQRKNLSMTDPNDRTQVIAVGAQSSRGIELAAGWRAVAAWQFAGHLSYTDARFDEFVETSGTATVSRAGNTPANSPDWVAGLTAAWQATPALSLALDWRRVGKRFANAANTIYEGAYELFGLGAAWQVDGGLLLRARVNNLADKTYSATVGANLAVLGAPRTVQLSADWRF
ncbi:MAG: TonB-dependent siderophore receptor [Burkholderiaceae bacterium]|nr:TonB-dependent siderophore receptor [Burkholderiaceae bacterium]